jgi:hypothetical protein
MQGLLGRRPIPENLQFRCRLWPTVLVSAIGIQPKWIGTWLDPNMISPGGLLINLTLIAREFATCAARSLQGKSDPLGGRPRVAGRPLMNSGMDGFLCGPPNPFQAWPNLSRHHLRDDRRPGPPLHRVLWRHTQLFPPGGV